MFWLDGLSEASPKQSFVAMVQRLPHDELKADSIALFNDTAIKADVAVRECQ